MAIDPSVRLLAKVAMGFGGCWIWTGGGNPVTGYGIFAFSGRLKVGVHRAAYTLFVGPIPPGLQIDHTCHNADPTCLGGNTCIHRRCVNPDHLEPVTSQVNNLRASRCQTAINAAKTHCPKGHPFSEANTMLRRRKRDRFFRVCRTCDRSFHRQSQAA